MRLTIASVLMTAVLVVSVIGLATACAHKPTQNQAIAIETFAAAAVSIAVQRDTNDSAVWARRAQLIVSVADQLRPLASDEAVSVVALTAAVGPLLDQANLQPGERLAGNALVAALARVIDANTSPEAPLAVTVVMVLDAVKASAQVYIPLGATPPTAHSIF
jgi:hypothetical protein